MKKYGYLLSLLMLGTVGITACSNKEAAITAYKQEGIQAERQAEPEVTDNTAPIQTDNQAESQNLEAGTASKEETPSTAKTTVSAKEDATKVTDQPNASNNRNNSSITATKAPTKAPAATKKPTITVVTIKPQNTYCPVETAKPQATKRPVVTVKPEATKRPVVTVKPEATKRPVVTIKPEATKTPSSDSSNNGTSNSSYASKVLDLVNEQRKANGLQPLTTTSTLQKAATKRAQEIVSTFSHTRPDGTSGVTVLKEYSISYNAWGENIAYGQRTPAAVMDSWMNSSGHRANILSAKFGKVGIGCYEQNGILYWTQVFTN